MKQYFLLPVLVVLMLLGAAFFIYQGYSSLTHTFDGASAVVERQNRIQRAISEMYIASQSRIQILLKMQDTHDAFELEALRQEMQFLASRYMTARDTIFSLVQSPEELERYYPEKFRAMITKNAALQNRAADLFVEQRHDEAYKVMMQYSVPEQKEILSGIALMNTMLDDDNERTLARLNREFQQSRFNFRVVGIFVFLASISLILFVMLILIRGRDAISGQLKAQQDRYKRIVDTVQDAIVTLDENVVVKDMNGGAEKIFDCRLEDLLGIPFSDLIAEADREAFRQYMTQLEQGDAPHGIDVEGRCPGGKSLFLHISLSALTMSGERLTIGVIRDVTVQKTLDEENARKTKLESIGVLAGGIAHDFNNILSGISGYLELARHALDNPEKLQHFLSSSAKAVVRASHLTQQLLTFSRGGDPVRENADIIEVIRESVEFSLHGSSIVCHYELDESIRPVCIDSGQISQVLQNLVINAKLAMPDGGELFVVCENCKGIEELPPAGDDDYIKISIRDTGCGIPDEMKKKIFDPYFTTREDGSGLGLALSYSIIRKHGGHIFVHSHSGQGACFTFYLPATGGCFNSGESHREPGEAGGITGKRVLVMDDDRVIREILQNMLQEMGADVITSCNGEEAVALYGDAMKHGRPVDLMIMDLTVPGGLGGKDALAQIRRDDPHARAIVCSGYSNDPVMANYRDYGFCAALSKPYDFEQLGRAVRASLSMTQC